MPINARDILSKNFSKINGTDTLSKALGKFKKTPKPYALLIFDDKNKFIGVVTERDIIRSFLDPEKTKVKALLRRLMRRAPFVEPETSIVEVTRLILEHELKYLPVFEKDKVKGIIRAEDILTNVVAKDLGNMHIDEFMVKEPYILSPNDQVSKALNMFKQKNISRAPVVEKGSLVGILTMHDIITKLYVPKSKETKGELTGKKLNVLNIPISGIMIKPVITCLSNSTVRDVIEEMTKRDITALVISDQKGRIEGIVTVKDLLKPLVKGEEKLRRKFFIEVSGDIDKLDNLDKERVSNDLQAFVDSFDSKFDEGYLTVHIQIHKERTRKLPMFFCKANFTTDKGKYSSKEKGWGIQNSLQETLQELERQIMKRWEKRVKVRRKSSKVM